MSANYQTIKEYQVTLVADTANVITLPAGIGTETKYTLTAPGSRTVPVSFIFRPAGSSAQPTTCAAGATLKDGTLSPSMKPGLPVQVENIPTGSVDISLKSPQAGDVYLTIYEVIGS